MLSQGWGLGWSYFREGLKNMKVCSGRHAVGEWIQFVVYGNTFFPECWRCKIGLFVVGKKMVATLIRQKRELSVVSVITQGSWCSDR
jgi:hypothetical protein